MFNPSLAPHDVARTLHAYFHEAGLGNIQVEMVSEGDRVKFVLVDVNPAAEYFMQSRPRLNEAWRSSRIWQDTEIVTWKLNNAQRKATLSIVRRQFHEMLTYGGLSAVYDLARQLERQWLYGLPEQITTEAVRIERYDFEVAASPPPTFKQPRGSRPRRVWNWLVEITTPRVFDIVDHPKGIYPSTGAWVE